jgi:ribose/xylose/arabinose/galactoside ABC-type transport system permease subunit
VVLSARLSAATPTAAVGFELNVIASVVLGGTPLTGGSRLNSRYNYWCLNYISFK